jgi:hypothetical protein
MHIRFKGILVCLIPSKQVRTTKHSFQEILECFKHMNQTSDIGKKIALFTLKSSIEPGPASPWRSKKTGLIQSYLLLENGVHGCPRLRHLKL